MVDLSIIIVSWNVQDLLRECLESIQSEIYSVEVIVVDSASTDGSPKMVEAEFAEVQLLSQSTNIGFTASNNVGIRKAAGRYIMLLNPDTVVLDNALDLLINYLDRYKNIGGIGPQLLNGDGSIQSSKRRFPTILTAFFESTWLERIAPPSILKRYYVRDVDDDKITPVDWVQGAALVIRREIINQVGYLDEDFFMYSEELDWQKRIKNAGWDIVYYPDAKIIHYGGKSSDQVIAKRHIYFQTSKIRYFRKHHGAIISSLLRAFLLFSYRWQLALEWAKGLLGHKPDLRKERVLAYLEVLQSGLRPEGDSH